MCYQHFAYARKSRPTLQLFLLVGLNMERLLVI